MSVNRKNTQQIQRTIRVPMLLFVTLFFSHIAWGKILNGKATRIVDGDTFDMVDIRRQKHRIRFTATDCPEKKQGRFGAAATKRLNQLLSGKTIRVNWDKRDFARRTVGLVFDGATDVGLELVREGHCAYYREYAGEISVAERGAYDQAETEARAAQRGIWSVANPVMPWDFRKNERRGKKKRK